MNSPLDRLLALLPNARKSGDGWSATCPAHEDRKASLSLSQGDDGTALVKCHAGCDTAAVLEAVGLKLADLFATKPGRTPSRIGKSKRTGRTFSTANEAVAELERRHGKRSMMWTYHDIDSNSVGVVVRWNLPEGGKDIRPITKDGEVWRIGAMPEPRPLLHLPSLASADLVLVHEGEKSADAARGLGFVATTSAGGSQAARKSDWSPLAGKTAWIFPDNDLAGRKYARDVVTILESLNPASIVRVIELPNLPEKGDIVNWIESHGDAADPESLRAEIEALAGSAQVALSDTISTSNDQQGKPTIVVGTDEYRVNDEAVDALASEADIYRRGGLLVHVLENTEGDTDPKQVIRRPLGAPVVRELPRALLRERLSRCACWKRTKYTPSGDEVEMAANPPDWCVGAVHVRGKWPSVRPLDAILRFPALMPDGSILATNGYQAFGRVMVQIPPDLKVSVPDRPSLSDVRSAAETLMDPVQDFPFEAPAHRSSLLAGLLTPLAWYLFDGPAPLFLIDKNVRGAGAGLLVDVVSLILLGSRFSVMTYSNDREELRKKITTLAMEGERMVLLDNLSGAFGNDVLDAALTSDWWKDRILGSNRIYDGPLHVVWFATGNNVQIHADTSRRICHVRMESQDERPEMRTGFRYPDLKQHVRDNRSRYLSAALTILRGWIVAGRPKHDLPPWGSFESWSGVVREALVFAGLPDPGETRLALQTAADRDRASMLDILQGMEYMDPTRRGLTSAEIVKRLKDDDGDEILASMRSAVEELCGKLDGRALGVKFRTFKRRNFGGKFIDVGGSAHGTNRWIVLSVRDGQKHANQTNHPHRTPTNPGGYGGDGGDVSVALDVEEIF